MSYLRTRQNRDVSGCCIIGMFLAVFYGIWRLIRAIAVALWRASVYFFKALYYLYAWPLLAIEYLWKRGGIYRLLGIGLTIILVIVLAIAMLSRNDPNAPGAPQPVEAAHARTITPTATTKRQIISTKTATRTATRSQIPTANSGMAKPVDAQAVRVVKVIDGDTVDVRMNAQTVRLRLIGIDTPESVDPRQPVQCFGIEASNYTKRTLLNQTVYLERDATQGEYDRYNRLLVYIWMNDTSLFNQKIIADGYAFEYTYRTPYRYQRAFKAAQQTARSNQNGLWSPTTCNGNASTGVTTTAVAKSPTIPANPTATMTTAERAYPCRVGQIKGNPDSLIYHVPTGRWYAQTRNNRVVCFTTEKDATLAGYRKSSS
ncbi:MAG: thermonuclease family protein [Chloroflexota bacterium]|jgi:endonuclease YncB( thermonuclease family)